MAAATIYQALIGAGLKPHQAAGFMGNFMEESTLKGGAFNKDEDAVGLAQWRGDRKEALRAYAASQRMDPDDEGVQARFAVHEMSTNPAYRKSWELLQNSRDAAEAARAVTTWEKPAGFDPKTFDPSGVPSMGDRIQHAQNFMNMGTSGQWGDSKITPGATQVASGATMGPDGKTPIPSAAPSTLEERMAAFMAQGGDEGPAGLAKKAAPEQPQQQAAPQLAVQSAESLSNSPDTSELMAMLLAKKKMAFMAQRGMA